MIEVIYNAIVISLELEQKKSDLTHEKKHHSFGNGLAIIQQGLQQGLQQYLQINSLQELGFL